MDEAGAGVFGDMIAVEERDIEIIAAICPLSGCEQINACESSRADDMLDMRS